MAAEEKTEGARGEVQGPRPVQQEHGVVLALAAAVQCLKCNSILEVKLKNADPENLEHIFEHSIGCPVCSREAGATVVIPLAVLAGLQVDEFLEDAVDEVVGDEQEAGEEVNEDDGPVQP